MGPETTMNNLNGNFNSELTFLAVPKLRDDKSNWSNYQPRLQNAMGKKGLWKHVEGTATALVPFITSNGIPMLADGKTPSYRGSNRSEGVKISRV
jgi:hypothetical protein